MRPIWLSLVLSLVAVSCEADDGFPKTGGPYLDARSDAAWKASLAAVRGTLGPEQLRAFNTGLDRLLGNKVVHEMVATTLDPGARQADPREFLHMMSAADVIDQGRTVKRTVFEVAIAANEAAAIANLQLVAKAQEELQSRAAIDVDRDGVGEFGFFGELTGISELRAPGTTLERGLLKDPTLSPRFSRIRNGMVTLSGYHFRVFLPGAGGAPEGEDTFGGADTAAVETELAERAWCCIAWPETVGETGQRVFFVNQASMLLAHPNEDGQLGRASGGFDPLLPFRSDSQRLDGHLAVDPKRPVPGGWTEVRSTMFTLVRENEAAAIAHLRDIATAQAKLREQCAIDVNDNKVGEFGFFSDLTGTLELRAGSGQSRGRLDDPLLGAEFGRINDRRVTVRGYRYLMFLPSWAGVPRPEDDYGGGKHARVDAVLAETAWCCIAWPETVGETGQRVFFVNQSGRVLAHPNADGALGRDTYGFDPLSLFQTDSRRLDGKLAEDNGWAEVR